MVTQIAIPTTTSVPKPPTFDLATDYARFGLAQWQAAEIIASRFTNRNGAKPAFIVLHIQDGTTRGSLSYWSSDAIDASSTVMIQKDGSILKIIPEQHGPWTNGDVNNPTKEASEILAKGGNPNIWSLTVEAEGKPADVMPQAQHDAIVWQVEDWIMRYPAILDSNWAILRHRFINSASRWRCPDEAGGTGGPYFNPVVADVNAWLGSPIEPSAPTTPVEPPSPYPPGMSPELAARLYGTVTVSWSSKPFAFDEHRSECAYWLARGQLDLKPGQDYTAGEWPPLRDVIRRGATKNIHVYQWANGDVYQKVIRKDQ